MSMSSFKQEFSCTKCGKEEAAPYTEAPRCCGELMRGGDYQFPVGDISTMRLHLITLLKTPEIDWQMAETPDLGVFELWRLAPGRARGERIGWIGARQTTVEWVMPPGVAIRGGFSNTIEEAAGHMLEALDGGVFASQHIKSEVVS